MSSIRILRSMVEIIEGGEDGDGCVTCGSLVRVKAQQSPYHGYCGHVEYRSQAFVNVVGLAQPVDTYKGRFWRPTPWKRPADA